MNEQATTNQEAVPEVATPPVSFKLTPAEVYSQLVAYDAAATKTLTVLQTNVDTANSQIAEWNRMRMQIIGQKQLVADLAGKLTGAVPQASSN
jgi:hypothetical protein